MQQSPISGKLITLEGIEGVGKSTIHHFVVNKLSQYLKVPIVQTREPGGTPMAEHLRDLALKPQSEPVSPDTELLLMFAARAQHVNQVILPALESGKWVVSDRFIDASYAYQGAGRGLDTRKIEMLEDIVLGGLKPDWVLILDAPVEVGMSRVTKRGGKDRFEEEKVEFFERVRACYLARAKADPARYTVIDASRSLVAVEAQVDEAIRGFLSREGNA